MLAKIKSQILRLALTLGYKIERVPYTGFSARRHRQKWAVEDTILRDAISHLDQIATSNGLPSLGIRWGTYAARLRSRIKSMSCPEELILFGQSPEAGVEKHFLPNELLPICQAIDLQLQADLPSALYAALPSFRSPRVIQSEWVVEHKGRPIDFVSLCAAQTVLTVLNLLGEAKPRIICDIGGGTGKYAKAWLTNSAHRAELVVIIDAPETLVYSEALLRSELGNQVQYLSDPSSHPMKSGVVLCPISNIRAIEGIGFDLVTNIGSMQEMTDDWIDWYMNFLDQQEFHYFWSQNYFANCLSNMHEGHNSWSPRPSPQWQLIYSRIDLGLRSTAALLFRKGGVSRGKEPKQQFSMRMNLGRNFG